jgi:hypothetical protein
MEPARAGESPNPERVEFDPCGFEEQVHGIASSPQVSPTANDVHALQAWAVRAARNERPFGVSEEFPIDNRPSSIDNPLPAPVFHDPKHHIKIYQGDCLEILAAIPEACVDMIFADPPYFLSNDGITCHAGKMVSVNKGE